jgi:outer membrane protein assembly factor BamB
VNSPPLATLLTPLLAPLLLASLAPAADWPTYRADAARSGYTAEALPPSLTLAWTFRPGGRPRPAWISTNRIHFDQAFQPIVAGGLVVLGSSANDQVIGLDLASGRVRWTFFTDGPVRFAPAAWRDRVLVASDDGCLYALRLTDGSLLWRHRGGPDARLCLGNERLISRWPARGGPVVVDDTVYYAAGIWPSDGVYLHALDAATGQARWTNADSGALYMPQPHPTAEARSGVAPQGYLLASSQHLFVPTGRAVPAAFDRATGKFLYYKLQENQQRGGDWAMLAGRFLLNASAIFDQATGDQAGTYTPGSMAAGPALLAHAAGDRLVMNELREMEKRDRRGRPVRYQGLEPRGQTSLSARAREVILARREAVCGQADRVSIVDLDATRERWSQPVEGAALGLAVSAGRLVVSTDQGVLYCFAPAMASQVSNAAPRLAAGPAPRGVASALHDITNLKVNQPAKAAITSPNLTAESASSTIDTDRAADEILQRSGVREGVCVDLGCGDGRLAQSLAQRSQLLVYGVESDPAKVAAARRRLTRLGLYPSRVAIVARDPAADDLPAYMANLVVSSAALASGRAPADARSVYRIQRPCGGAACLGPLGHMETKTRGPLEGAGQWTHQNYDPANTLCSSDQRVKGPLSALWFRDVDFEIASRHGQPPAPLSARGYLVVEGVDGVCTLDAYNGRTLWTYWIEGVLKDFDGVHHDVAVGDTGSNICLGDDSVYVAAGDRCLRLDLASGRKLAEFPTPAGPRDHHRAWGYLACHDGLLLGSIANADHAVSPRYAGIKLRTESVLLFALDAHSGKLRWTYRPKDSLRHNAIAVAAGRVYLIDRPIALADRITEPKPGGTHRPLLKPGQQPGGVLVALDAATGKPLWRQADDVFGTQLAVGPRHDLLLMSYQAVKHNFFKLPSEVGGRMAVFDASNGRRVWDREAHYLTRPILNGDTIYAEGGTWDLRTGQDLPFKFHRSYGCGQICSSTHMMLFRSGTLGYWDLSRDVGVENFGGVRPSCWFSAIPAGGLVLVPDGSSKCVCSYQMQAWLALQPPGSQ